MHHNLVSWLRRRHFAKYPAALQRSKRCIALCADVSQGNPGNVSNSRCSILLQERMSPNCGLAMRPKGMRITDTNPNVSILQAHQQHQATLHTNSKCCSCGLSKEFCRLPLLFAKKLVAPGAAFNFEGGIQIHHRNLQIALGEAQR